jgi:hypothetical protein
MSKIKNKSTKSDYSPRRTPSFTSIYQENIYISYAFKKIKARFNSKCYATGKLIPSGSEMWYDYANKTCFAMDSI